MIKVTSLPPVELFATIDSTNAEAKRRALSGQRGPIWLRADAQSKGVGRGGREWYAPHGNLYATLLTPFSGEIRNAALMSFVAALAVADTLDAFAPASLVSLKWPNDVLLDGRKVAGILLEAGGEANERWLAIGIGINLISKPAEARWPPISVSEIAEAPSPEAAWATLAEALEIWQAEFENHGFDPIRAAWLPRASHLGRQIEARVADRSYTGIFENLEGDGTLLLATDEGDIRISAADIYFPA